MPYLAVLILKAVSVTVDLGYIVTEPREWNNVCFLLPSLNTNTSLQYLLGNIIISKLPTCAESNEHDVLYKTEIFVKIDKQLNWSIKKLWPFDMFSFTWTNLMRPLSNLHCLWAQYLGQVRYPAGQSKKWKSFGTLIIPISQTVFVLSHGNFYISCPIITKLADSAN